MRSPLRLSERAVPPGYTGTRLTACNLCEAICGLELTITDGQVTGVRGNPADPLSRGYLCPKGVALPDVYADPDRLRRPLVRRGDDWVETGWDEAFDLVADRLAETVNRHGPDAVGVYLGNPNVHALGSLTHNGPFVKALGTRNRFSATTVDQAPAQLVAWQLFGHQLLHPGPRPGPHVVLPGARGEPDGVERLPDDRTGLPEARPGDQGAWRSDRGARPTAYRDGRRSPPSTGSSARGATWWCCSRCCARCWPRAWPARRRTSTAWTGSASWSSRSPRSSRRS